MSSSTSRPLLTDRGAPLAQLVSILALLVGACSPDTAATSADGAATPAVDTSIDNGADAHAVDASADHGADAHAEDTSAASPDHGADAPAVDVSPDTSPGDGGPEPTADSASETTVDAAPDVPIGECTGDEECDDGIPCTTDTCGADHACTVTVDWNACLIDGVCISSGDTKADAPCASCQPAISSHQWSPIVDACDDDVPCTVDACDVATGCLNTLLDACFIGEACIAADTVKPGADCMTCQPAVSESDWTEVAAACEDSQPCTTDVCDPDVGCSNTLVDDACIIDGTCRDADETKAEAECWSCQPSLSTGEWTEIVDACDDGAACTVDVCDPSTGCANTLEDGFCLIDGVCHPEGEENPDNQCQTCQPSVSTSAWSNRTGDCDDGEDCTWQDTCDDGACVATPYSCDDGIECTTNICYGNGFCANFTLDGWCQAFGECYPEGWVNPDNECQHCSPSATYKGLSAVPHGTPCTSDGLACTLDFCHATVCTHQLHPDVYVCLIDDTCYGGGQLNPNQPCQVCDPSTSKSDWTVRPPGAECEECSRCDGLSCNPASDLDFAPCDDEDSGTVGDWCRSGSCSGFTTKTTDTNTGDPNDGYTHATEAPDGGVHALYKDCPTALCTHRGEYFAGTSATPSTDSALGLAVARPGFAGHFYTSLDTLWFYAPSSGWTNTGGLADVFSSVAPDAIWHTVGTHFELVLLVVNLFGWQPSTSSPVALRCTWSALCPTCPWECVAPNTIDPPPPNTDLRECVGQTLRVHEPGLTRTMWCNDADSSGTPTSFNHWSWQGEPSMRWWGNPAVKIALAPGQRLMDADSTNEAGVLVAGTAGLLSIYYTSEGPWNDLTIPQLGPDQANTDFKAVTRFADHLTVLLAVTTVDVGGGQENSEVSLISTEAGGGEMVTGPDWKRSILFTYTCPSAGPCPYEATSLAAADDGVYVFGAWSTDGVERDRAVWYWAAP